MINAPIPKKEYQDLLNELLRDLPELNTFELPAQAVAPSSDINGGTATVMNESQCSFDPNVNSTPNSNRFMAESSPLIATTNISNAVTNANNSFGGTTANNFVQYPINPLTFSPMAPILMLNNNLPLILDMSQLNAYQCSFIVNNMQPNFTSPTVAPPPPPPPPPSLCNEIISLIESESEDVPKPLSPHNKKQNQWHAFKYLEHEAPAAEQVCFSIQKYPQIFIDFFIQVFDKDATGFTHTQLQVLEQQLRVHVQLATQSFLQSYGHPTNNLWQQAAQYKDMLHTLNGVLTESNVVSSAVSNLPAALQLIDEWETELSENCSTNQSYVE